MCFSLLGSNLKLTLTLTLRTAFKKNGERNYFIHTATFFEGVLSS